MKQHYQGDVPVLEIKKEDKPVSYAPLTAPLIVAYGEVTGHTHTLERTEGSIVEVAKDERGYFLKVKKGTATLTHQEHAQQTFGVGLYFIGEQVEYDELEERKVLD